MALWIKPSFDHSVILGSFDKTTWSNMKQHRTGLRWSLPINMQLPKAKELPPCNTEPPITTWTHSQICMHLAKLTIKPTSLYVAECCVRYHSPESSWFLGIVNISYTGTCRGKERRLSEWYLQESCQGVLEKQNALVKSTVYLPFFFCILFACMCIGCP